MAIRKFKIGTAYAERDAVTNTMFRIMWTVIDRRRNQIWLEHANGKKISRFVWIRDGVECCHIGLYGYLAVA